ncbi:hypothetical protein Pfo_005479 [Paulownia fortunei]|nr:hypothetical protein Pfo_005479 [Paulownia fortunei]
MYPRKPILHLLFSLFITCFIASVLVAAKDVPKTPTSMGKNHSSFTKAKNISDFIPPAPRRPSPTPPSVPRRCRLCWKRVGRFPIPLCCSAAAKVDNKKGTKN